MTATMIKLRFPVLLVLATVLVADMGLAGCASPAGSVTILGPWSDKDEEGKQFRHVLDAFEQRYGIHYNYVGTPAASQVLQSGVQKGTPPDIAVLPSPGDLATYRKDLTPLDGILGEDWTTGYSTQWQKLAKAGLDQLYAVPIRANLKGLVWYNVLHPPVLQPRGKLPSSFDELTAVRPGIVDGTPWCMGVSAQYASGWPGTDWIKDILLHQSGTQSYEKWASGELAWTSPEVKKAWQTWGDAVTRPGQLFGGPNAALLTDFGDAAKPMFDDRPGCLMEHQASFMSGFYSGYKGNPQPDSQFTFLDFTNQKGQPHEVAADLAGMFRDTPQARELIRFLISEQAQKKWPDVGAFSASTKVPATAYHNEVGRSIAATLAGTDPLCFDASDLMPATMRGAFYRAVLEYLSTSSPLDTLLGQLEQVHMRLLSDQSQWLNVACRSN